MIHENTPVESIRLGNKTVLVKREDLCVDPPAPPFSKMRGVMKYLQALKDQGITTVGYVETSISMAGWGIAYACKELGMKAIIFDPQYKKEATPKKLSTVPLHEYHRRMWAENDVHEVIPIKAGMAKVNFYIARKMLVERYPDAVLLPLGIPFEDSIEETAKETKRTLLQYPDVKSIVTVVGSGTIAAGIWRGAAQTPNISLVIYGIACREGNMVTKYHNIKNKARLAFIAFLKKRIAFDVYDMGWKYTTPSQILPSFPCHPYYDLKAWQWLVENAQYLSEPIMFWNVGSEPIFERGDLKC